MAKLTLLALALCVATVCAGITKRDAPSTPPPDFFKNLEESASEFFKKVGDNVNAENIQKKFKESTDSLKETFDANKLNDALKQLGETIKSADLETKMKDALDGFAKEIEKFQKKPDDAHSPAPPK